MRSEFRTHVVQVDTVVGRFWRTDVAITSKEGSRAHGCRGFIAFIEGEVELIPSVFNAWHLVAVYRISNYPKVNRSSTRIGRSGPLEDPGTVFVGGRGLGVSECLLVHRTVNLPVLCHIAGQGAKRDSH